MKKKILVSLIASTLLNASGLSLANMGSNLTDGVTNSLTNSVTKSVSGTQTSATNYFFNSFNGGVNGAGAGSIMGMCYNYNPKGVKGVDFNLNICNAIANLTNVCALAPSLSTFGYSKKSNANSISGAMKNYCNSIFGTSSSTVKRTSSELIQNVNFNNSVYRDVKTNSLTTPFSDTSSMFATSSPLNISNAYENRKNKDNQVYNTIATNDYKSMRAYKMVMKDDSNNAIAQNTNFKNINVPYETISDYDTSVESFRSDKKIMLESLSLVELSKKAEQAFEKINTDTSDAKESNTQKQAQLATFLDEYKEIVDKWANIEMNVQLMINYKEDIVYPTKEMVNKYEDVDRARIVYRIENQKTQKVELLSKIDKQAQDMKDEAYIVLRNELLRSIQFDRNSALAEIEKLIS